MRWFVSDGRDRAQTELLRASALSAIPRHGDSNPGYIRESDINLSRVVLLESNCSRPIEAE